jgi:hypothetical protein
VGIPIEFAVSMLVDSCVGRDMYSRARSEATSSFVCRKSAQIGFVLRGNAMRKALDLPHEPCAVPALPLRPSLERRGFGKHFFGLRFQVFRSLNL